MWKRHFSRCYFRGSVSPMDLFCSYIKCEMWIREIHFYWSDHAYPIYHLCTWHIYVRRLWVPTQFSFSKVTLVFAWIDAILDICLHLIRAVMYSRPSYSHKGLWWPLRKLAKGYDRMYNRKGIQILIWNNLDYIFNHHIFANIYSESIIWNFYSFSLSLRANFDSKLIKRNSVFFIENIIKKFFSLLYYFISFHYVIRKTMGN